MAVAPAVARAQNAMTPPLAMQYLLVLHAMSTPAPRHLDGDWIFRIVLQADHQKNRLIE
jgi:hypothetical protein